MIVDLKKCAEHPLELERVLDVAPRFASYPEIETIGPVDVRLRIAPVGGNQYLVRGKLETALTAYCARCLESFEQPLRQEFQLTYLPESARHEEVPGETAMQTGEVDLAYYSDDKLEIPPLVEEQVNLALPMRFLCAEACPGLCPVCGASRKTTACGCAQAPLDPRFESLKALIK